MTITGLIKYIVAMVGNIAKGIINIDYKVIIKVFIEAHFKEITRRNTMFIRS
jgi:paraquat-inducible protein B